MIGLPGVLQFVRDTASCRPCLVWAAGLALVFHGTVAAQQSDGLPPLPVAEAAPASQPIRLDGRLDEASWQAAVPVTSFTQNDPQEGRPVSQPTSVRIVYDDEAIYVGAVLHDAYPVSSRLGRRDDWLIDSDWFSVAFDSYNDNLTAYRFQVNPAGVRSDEVMSGGNTRGGDDSWDPVWQAATTVTDSGWVAEMRIPFSQLRFSAARDQVWGVQLQRTIARRREEAVFAFTPKAERGGVARYGQLVGLQDLHRGAGLELMPYVVGRGEYRNIEQSDDATFPNPYRDGSDYFASTGLDLKYRVASNLTLDATVNPDFGQVELDPAVVNLTAFETRFEEKRPFFVEGGDIFRFGGSGGGGRGPGGGGGRGGTQLLYSRRIGASPPGGVPDEAAYHDAPEVATILGAGKLTGRTGGGWSVGLLEAVTQEETSRYIDATGTEGVEVVAPLSNFLVARVQRNLREGQTVVGAMATAANRRVGGLDLAGELRGDAYAGGVDFRHEWANRAWSLSGYVAGSRIGGTAGAIDEAQTSSARYFQRPDADHLMYDPAATSLAGYAANLELRKDAGEHWRGNVQMQTTSPGFEVNDLGYQRDADRIRGEARLQYVENQPGEVFREWNIDMGPDATWNYGGDFLGMGLDAGVRWNLLSYWGGNIDFSHDLAGYDDRLTRGGPLTQGLASSRASLHFSSDFRKPWTLRANTSYEWDEAGGEQIRVGMDVNLKPSSSWSISLGPNWRKERASAQYVETVDDPLATSTYGARYIFAPLDQTTVSLETRLNVTFKPGLTLELYAQPFIASGDYDGLMELAAPRTFDFVRYGVDAGTITMTGDEFTIDPDGAGPAAAFTVGDKDFNRRSLRGNAVLRWEWRPGSTLFLVWQQARSDYADSHDLRLSRDARAMFAAPADNVFVLKVSYWFNP